MYEVKKICNIIFYWKCSDWNYRQDCKLTCVCNLVLSLQSKWTMNMLRVDQRSKLVNGRSNVRLHSHDIHYGSGSGQQVSNGDLFVRVWSSSFQRVLGQLPMRTIPHQIKIKPNHCPPGPQSLGLFPTRTIPHQDNSPLGPLPRNKTTHQDQNLYGGELSSWGVESCSLFWKCIHVFRNIYMYHSHLLLIFFFFFFFIVWHDDVWLKFLPHCIIGTNWWLEFLL